MYIAIVAILILIVLGLIFYNITIHKKIQKFKNMNQRITNLYVVQDFMNAIGETSSVENKIKKINDILIERYEIKYSTIVIFDGTEYKVKASNVDQRHWDALKSLHTLDMFKDSIQSATPKYVTVNTESGTPHDFDNVDTTVLEVIKENIVSVLKTVVHQKTLESIVRKDLFTGLYSEEYLYGEGKKVIDQYTISTICMFKITNLQQINKDYCRELGNKVITEISNYIRDNISSEYIFVRYMGPKFVIAFSGVEAEGVADFLNDIKEKIEATKIKLTDEELEELKLDVKSNLKTSKTKQMETVPRLNFVISSYYKGTGLEEVLKKLESYLDNANINESDITNI